MVLPEGVAFKLDPKQPIFLQLHYINLTGAPLNIVGKVVFELVDDACVAHVR